MICMVIYFFSYYWLFRKFSFCQYPFILSLAAKRFIMQKDSESQMIVMARVGCTVVKVFSPRSFFFEQDSKDFLFLCYELII